ncbi:MAG: hypothetical protein ABL958_13485 [Bdellovibrionia bacterium]
MTRLSKQSRVSRTLIYYYFGKSKLGILREGVNLFGAEFAGVTPERVAMWREGKIAESLTMSRALLKQMPQLASFYFLYRDEETEVGEAIRDKEKQFKEKLVSFFPHLSQARVDGLFAGFWGIVFAPAIDEDAVREIARALLKSASEK